MRVRCKRHKTKLNVLCGKSPHVATRIWCILRWPIYTRRGLRIKNPSSSIYNLVHLKKEWNYPFFRVKVLEGQAGHAKNSLGRHYLRSRALWQSLLGGKDIGKDWLSLLGPVKYTKIIWNGKFALVRPKHLSSRPKTKIRPNSLPVFEFFLRFDFSSTFFCKIRNEKF